MCPHSTTEEYNKYYRIWLYVIRRQEKIVKISETWEQMLLHRDRKLKNRHAEIVWPY